MDLREEVYEDGKWIKDEIVSSQMSDLGSVTGGLIAVFKCKVIPISKHNATNAYRWTENEDQYVLNLDTTWK